MPIDRYNNFEELAQSEVRGKNFVGCGQLSSFGNSNSQKKSTL